MLRAVKGSSGGFTQIELVVVSIIMGFMVLVVGTFLANGLKTYQYLQLQSQTAADQATNIERISRVVRGATSIITAQAGTLTVYAYFSPADAVVDQVRYFVSGTNLQVGVITPTGTAPNYTYNAATERITTLSTSATSSSLFTYFDASGVQLPAGFSMGQVKQVGISLTNNPNSARLPVPLKNQTTVTLRNLKTNL